MMKKLIGGSALAIASALAFSSSASAADIVYNEPAPVVVEQAKSPWQIRVRALGVIVEDEGKVHQVPGSELDFSDTMTPELDITYFFTDNFAAELILGTSYTRVKGQGAINNLDVGKVWFLPPTLTLQYHFTQFGAFKPYVGAGVNYTFFYNQDEGRDLSYLKVKDEWGAAVQVGFDYMFDDHWGFNFDVKKLWLRPDFEGRLAPTDGALIGTYVTGKAELDPWLIGAGITYRF